MKTHESIGIGTVYGWVQTSYTFIMVNLCFIAANLLFLFFFLTLNQTSSNSWIYYAALLPAGPSIYALLRTMDAFIRGGEVAPARSFWQNIRRNVLESSTNWLVMITVAFLLGADIFYLNGSSLPGKMIGSAALLVILIIWLLVSMNVLIIQTRFTFQKKALWRLSAYYLAEKWKTAIVNVCLVAVGIGLLAATSGFSILFTFSITAFFVMKNSQMMMEDIQKRFVKKV